MTYEERREYFCTKCSQYNSFVACNYLVTNTKDRCGRLDAMMTGWDAGRLDAIMEMKVEVWRNLDLFLRAFPYLHDDSPDKGGYEAYQDMLKFIKGMSDGKGNV